MTEYETIQVDRTDSIARLTLDSSSGLNSLTLQQADELIDAITSLSGDQAVRCLVLTGTDDAFCTGADLSSLDGDERDESHLRTLASRLHDAVLQLHQLDTPVVVGINGTAAGAGVGLALSGDLVVMAADSTLRFAYPQIGLTGDGGATFLLPRLVGLRRAKEIALLDEPIGADHAVSLGLVSDAVDPDAFEDRLDERAHQLADGPTAALAATKRLLTESFDRDLAGQLGAETDAIGRATRTEDYQRGLAAFDADEDPEFVGR